MMSSLNTCLKFSKNFDELEKNMHKLGFRISLSQNVKIGISGMRIVRYEDINHQTERQYKPGYKLSEITNKLKIKDVKQKLAENYEKSRIFSPTATNEFTNTESKKSPSAAKHIENLIEDFIKSTYTAAPDDELLKKKKRKFR